MEKFKYVAVDVNKKRFRGSFLAESESHLREQLAQQNLYLVKCSQVNAATPSSFWSVSGKVKTSELTTFCRQFSIMITSGISIVDSVAVLKQQSYSSYLKSVLEFVHEDINSGSLLSEAMKKHPKAFPDFFQNMVYVGEMSGSLDNVLSSIADYYESDHKIKKQVKSALSYPIMLVVMLFAVLILLVVFVIPTFIDTLGAMDVEMPGIALALYDVSQFIMANWQVIFLIVLVLVVAFLIFRKTGTGKMFLDMLKVKIPLIKRIQIALQASRFARCFSLLLASGMDVLEALEVVSVILGNRYVEKEFKKVVDDVRQGKSLTESLTEHKLFPDMLTQMVAVGEKTGSLDSVLSRCCTYFDEQVATTLTSVTGIIQPVVLCVMGGVIAVVFYAVYSPMLEIMTKLTAK